MISNNLLTVIHRPTSEFLLMRHPAGRFLRSGKWNEGGTRMREGAADARGGSLLAFFAAKQTMQAAAVPRAARRDRANWRFMLRRLLPRRRRAQSSSMGNDLWPVHAGRNPDIERPHQSGRPNARDAMPKGGVVANLDSQ